MVLVASLLCGFIFGCGLLISGMLAPTKVLAFLDVLGDWDPSLAVVMLAAITVTRISYWFARRRGRPLLADRYQWPTKTKIDAPLVIGAMVFGAGWGLVGLCPGPAVENLATRSLQVLIFVTAMLTGMALHDLWQRRSIATTHAATAKPVQVEDS